MAEYYYRFHALSSQLVIRTASWFEPSTLNESALETAGKCGQHSCHYSKGIWIIYSNFESIKIIFDPVVRTARPERLSSGGDWKINGVGRNVSHSFGYGLLDATGMVRLAKSWKSVPPQRRCELAALRPQRSVPPRSSVTLQVMY